MCIRRVLKSESIAKCASYSAWNLQGINTSYSLSNLCKLKTKKLINFNIITTFISVVINLTSTLCTINVFTIIFIAISILIVRTNYLKQTSKLMRI